MKKHVFTVLAATILAGCASNSQDIKASYVPNEVYTGMTCSQISSEASKLSNKINSLSKIQNEKANADAAITAVSVILFWPAAFFVSGDGTNADELAKVKGQAQALNQVSVDRGCGPLQ